jgi:ABC-type bacteriocin/lantibiotic exporter with double-glycine peptidase domain
LSSQSTASAFNNLPPHLISTLDNMAFGIAQKEDKDAYEIKQKLVANINKLAPADLDYLITQMSMLIEKSVHENEEISDKNVDKNFISFLIRLYY